MKNILCPTDFSKSAADAIKVATAMAKASKARIHFLHVLNTPVDWSRVNKEQEKIFPATKEKIAEAKVALERLKKAVEKEGLKAKTTLIFDADYKGVLKAVEDVKHDFIVMGTQGASPLKELFVGTNAQRIIRHSQVPVLVVRKKPARFQVNNILFASDFESDSNKSLDKLVPIAKSLKAQVHLLYVNTPNSFETTADSHKRLEKAMKKCPAGTTTAVYNDFNVEDGVLAYAKEVKADIIAVRHVERGHLVRMLSHGLTEALANHTDTPVLSFNN